MQIIYPFIVPYDAGSKISKTSNSLAAWKNIFPNAEFLERQNSEMLLYMLEAKVLQTAQEGNIPFMLGGDHSLTYYACKSLTSLYGPLNILVFDAHHDSYVSPHLNHYTVLYHIQKLLKAKIKLVGCRKDLAKNILQQANHITSPCYISLDVDFFDPQYISSVVDPVAPTSVQDNYYSFETFCTELEQLKCKIVGADIMEWGGTNNNCPEYDFVYKIAKKMQNIISCGMTS